MPAVAASEIRYRNLLNQIAVKPFDMLEMSTGCVCRVTTNVILNVYSVHDFLMI